jgi:hypothetical protein
VLKYCKNMEESITRDIKVNFISEWDERYILKYCLDDLEIAKMEVLQEVADLVWEVEVWAKEFKEFLTDMANAKEWNVLHSYITQWGFSPSEKKFTQKDKNIVALWEYRILCAEQNRLTALIGSLEDKKPKEIEWVYE